MAREIKFRLWDIDNELFNYIDLTDLDQSIETLDSFRDYFSRSYFKDESYIQQYTALTDKNGKDIYEGDILRWTSCNPFSLGDVRTVSVSYVQAQFWCNGITPKRFGVYLAELLANEKCEVIGNIYETPNH